MVCREVENIACKKATEKVTESYISECSIEDDCGIVRVLRHVYMASKVIIW